MRAGYDALNAWANRPLAEHIADRDPDASLSAAIADAALAAVAAHDGLAEVLRAHQERETTVRDGRPVLLCECGHELHFSAKAEADHLADVVRAWMVQP